MRLRSFISLGLFVGLITAPLSAQEDAPRFDESGFIESLDLFIAEQNPRNARSGTDGSKNDLSLSTSLRDSSKKGNFLYLQDARHLQQVGVLGALDSADFSRLYALETGLFDGLPGDVSSSSLYSGLGVGARTSVFGLDQQGIQLALESAYRLSRLSTSSGLADESGLYAEQYNLGLSVGAGGLYFGAGLVDGASVLGSELSGYGLGLSYQGERFAARLSLQDYKEGSDLLGIDNAARSVFSVNLGANLRLTDRIGLSSRLGFTDYNALWAVGTDMADEDRSIYLGGSFDF